MKITVVYQDNDSQKQAVIPFKPGHPLRRILNATEHRVRMGCRGDGSCGLCLVRIIEGEPSPPNESERLQLSTHQLASGIRLACQVICENDLKVEIINRIPVSEWRPIPDELYRHTLAAPSPLRGASVFHERRFSQAGGVPFDIPIGPSVHVSVDASFGVAVDLGTTSISLSMFDMNTGHLLTTRHGINPQIKYGSDVLTRIGIASESPSNSKKMQQDVIKAIRNALWDISVGDGIDLGRVCRLVLVGNTAMTTLLAGADAHLLLNPGYWDKPINLPLPAPSDWAAEWGINLRSDIHVLPPMAGFIGSDLTAGIVATGLMDHPGSMLIDFGTNSEIALWDGSTLWITSAAGGPAFEGSGISCGMPAETGAIYRVDLTKNIYAVIGETKALGICGSGLVDLLADLIFLDVLNPIGQFSESSSKQCFDVTGSDAIRLTKKDVDLIQRAKSGIATGVQVLLQQAGKTYKDLTRVFIAGAFGYHLDIEKALRIGLLPPSAPDIFYSCGNSALTGCERILLQADADKTLTKIKQRFKIVNMADYQDFEELFFNNLFIKPMQSLPWADDY